MNWWIWRVTTSKDIPDGLSDIRRHWSFRDLLDAHITLDTLEGARDVIRKEAEAEAARRRG